MIVLDEFDGHNHFVPFSDPKDMIKAGYKPHPTVNNEFLWYYMYFKRSYVVRKGGIFQYFPHLTRPDFYPITYSLAEAYLRPKFNFKREMEIVCTLRGSKTQPARLRVQTWVEEYAKERKVDRAVVGQVYNVHTRIHTTSTHSLRGVVAGLLPFVHKYFLILLLLLLLLRLIAIRVLPLARNTSP
jgi:hypothetical protein